MPGQFIPIAEESYADTRHRPLGAGSGLSPTRVVGKNERTRDLTLAVNVSAKQFAQPSFVS